jgi:hypothetical protein
MVEKKSTTTPNMLSKHRAMLENIILAKKTVSFANNQKAGKL